MSAKVNIREILEGLDTTTRKADRNEICVYTTSKFEPELYVGVRDVETRVLTADASETLLERLNAELRVPCKGDRVLLEDGKWTTATYDYVLHAICEKAKKPEYRKLEPGEPAMPGDRLMDSAGNDMGIAENHYKHPHNQLVQDTRQSMYARTPWTPEEYLQRQAEWVEFHNLKPGDTVKVCCKAKSKQDGWENSWLRKYMNGAVGKELKVTDVFPASGVKISAPGEEWDELEFPFYVLQVVKKPTPVKPEPVKPTPVKPEPVKPTPVKPEPKYREFRTPQEVLAWVQEHGQIVVNDNGTWGSITGCSISGDNQLYIPGCFTYGYYKNGKSLKDGTTFGVPE